MSEETLRRVLERLDTDEAFRDSLKRESDWKDVVGELDLSPAEIAAISTQDEDALRRLAGADVTGYQYQIRMSFYTTNLICSWMCFTTIDTPGSGRHCGGGGGGEPAPDPTDPMAVNCCASTAARCSEHAPTSSYRMRGRSPRSRGGPGPERNPETRPAIAVLSSGPQELRRTPTALLDHDL
jgi:hypothetical protein